MIDGSLEEENSVVNGSFEADKTTQIPQSTHLSPDRETVHNNYELFSSQSQGVLSTRFISGTYEITKSPVSIASPSLNLNDEISDNEWKPHLNRESLTNQTAPFNASKSTEAEETTSEEPLWNLSVWNNTKNAELKENQDPSASPTVKFSLLQWFNSQLNNAKINSRPSSVNVTTLTSSHPPVLSSPKPTAISYSGVQPVLRPKPSPTDDLIEPTEHSLSSVPHLSGFSISTLNKSFSEPIVGLPTPRPIKVQTIMTIREPSRSSGLVESPRTSKSLSHLETATHELNSTTKLQVALLKDFFPPVRRPVRPHAKVDQGSNPSTILPIEDLFTTVVPFDGHPHGKQHPNISNSPIYTFKVSQGTNLQEVLIQLLADLTTGESPANLDISGVNPIIDDQMQSGSIHHHNSNNNKKASVKKIDDDSLKPWSQIPFRPTVLNTLFQSSIHQNATIILNSTTTNITSSGTNEVEMNITTELTTPIIASNTSSLLGKSSVGFPLTMILLNLIALKNNPINIKFM